MNRTFSMGGSRGVLLQPKMPTQNYKTFQIAAPVDTHMRPATCAEIGCTAFEEGWTFEKSALVANDLYELVTHAGKRYREMSLDDSATIYLVFEPGQPCFQARSHRISLNRPQFFFSGRGDARTYTPRRAYQYADGEEWSDAFANHQDIIKRVHDEGI